MNRDVCWCSPRWGSQADHSWCLSALFIGKLVHIPWVSLRKTPLLTSQLLKDTNIPNIHEHITQHEKSRKNQGRPKYPVVSAFGPGSVIDVSTHPLVKQNLFHLFSIPLRHGSQWFVIQEYTASELPDVGVIRPGLYHSWSFVAPYHRSTVIQIKDADLVWVGRGNVYDFRYLESEESISECKK